MPAKNSVKQFVENGYYHLYNRGVNKADIFLDDQDYSVLLGFLKKYLDPDLGSDPHSLSSEVELLAFCLMPNHVHFLAKQRSLTGITKLMRAVFTNYVMYFNKKYNRVGTLFQGKYKAALIDNDTYLLHLSRYIHLNPTKGSDPKTYPYSSYNYYLGEKNARWLKPDEVLSFFKSSRKLSLRDYLSYESFVDDYQLPPEEILGNLTIDE